MLGIDKYRSAPAMSLRPAVMHYDYNETIKYHFNIRMRDCGDNSSYPIFFSSF